MSYIRRLFASPIPAVISRHQRDWGFWDDINHVDPDPTPPPNDPAPTATPPNDYPAGLRDEGQKALDAMKAERAQLKEQLRQTQAQMKAFEGMDPSKYAEAMRIADQQIEWARQKSELEASLKQQYEPQIQERDTQLTQHKSALANYYADVAAEQAFLAADGIAGEFAAIAPAVQQRMQVDTANLEFDASGRLKLGSVKVQVLDEKGQPMFVDGKPATMAELIKDLASKHTWIARHFKGNNTPGFQLGGKGDFSAQNPNMAKLPAWQRVNLQRQQAGR